MGFKIEGWSAKDFRNLSLVDIEVEDYILRVSGNNGAGKSSVIEAIFIAMLGPKYAGKNPQRMIQTGKDTATITVRLKDGDRDMEITRIISETGMKLKVKTSDGSKVSQAYLDGLINLTMIDPLSWAESKPADQIADLKEKAGIDTSGLEKDYDEIFSERTFQNREVKRLTGVVDSFEDIVVPDYVMSLTDAHEAKNKAIERNSSAERKNSAHKLSLQKIKNLEDRRDSIQDEILKLQDEVKKINTERTQLVEDVADFNEFMIEDLTGYDEDIVIAEEQSSKMSLIKEKKKAEEDLIEATEISNESTTRLDDIKKEIEDVIEEAELPFDDISFDNDLGVLVSGLPISEHSTAEQIKIAVRLNSKFAPHLKVVYIKDGSLLDKNTLAELEDLSVDEEMLFLVELVEEQEDSIIMRSGHVVEEGE